MQSEVAFLLRLLNSLAPDGTKPGDDDHGFWLIWMRLGYLGLRVVWRTEEKTWGVIDNA